MSFVTHTAQSELGSDELEDSKVHHESKLVSVKGSQKVSKGFIYFVKRTYSEKLSVSSLNYK